MTNISNSHTPPKEKMLTDGVDSLNTAELISILIGRGPNGKSAVKVAG